MNNSVLQKVRSKFKKMYEHATIPELIEAQKTAKELYRVNGPTYDAVARCEIIYELLKEWGT